MQDLTAQDLVTFWRDAGPEKWFAKDDSFDALIKARFTPCLSAGQNGAFDHWMKEGPEGYLGLILLFDQVPRNSFRHSSKAWSYDHLARGYARKAVETEADQQLDPSLRGFVYLPFMHSEDLVDQQFCLTLYEAFGDETGLAYAKVHFDIIERFGRFPHRNALLGREMTLLEKAFLDEGGFQG